MADITVTAKKIRPLLGALTVRREANAALTVGDIVQVLGTGKVDKTNGAALGTTDNLIGMIVGGSRREPDGAIVAGEICDICILGRVAGFSGLDETKDLYVSNTAGKMADAAGTVERLFAFIESEEVIFINPQDVDDV